MKKFLILSVLFLWAAQAGFAQEIRSIEENVVLRDDGSAQVTQVWDVTVVSGTEWYLPFDNLGPMDITDLSVSENGVEYISEGDRWDTDRSREQKRGRCGIVRKRGGVELCWGQGDYGDHVWTVRYTITGLTMRMADGYNGLYFTFVNPGLSAPPRRVRLTILNGCESGAAWTPENTRVWGFRSESEIYVEDGAIRAESLAPFGRNSAMTVLVRFDPELFTPAVSYEKTFGEVQQKAFEGSDYADEEMTFWEKVIVFLVLLVFVPLPLGFLAGFLISYHLLGNKYKKRIFGAKKITGWSRDIPVEGNLPAAYYALREGDRMPASALSNRLIGAYFLRWVLGGQVGVLPDPKKNGRVNLSFGQEATFSDPVEGEVYRMARAASGDNLILEAGEFERWSKKSYKRVSDLPERAKLRGRKWFAERNLLLQSDRCNEAGQQAARQVVEFKNYLDDFTLSKQRGTAEVALWQDYLVFAALFGISDKVAKEFERLYPAEFAEFTQSRGMSSPVILYDTMRVSNNISAAAMRNAAAEKAARSGGSGGGFSVGGGGGSFGGSFGGGSR